MSNRVEKLLDVPNYAPVIGVYDLGLKKGSFDSGFQSFEYRDFSIVGYPGEERQADPASIEDGRFSLTADGIVPSGLVRETRVGRWQLIARKLGYSNIPFQPKHHDNNGSSRTLSIGAEAIDTPDKAQQIAASLFGKFESDTPVEDFIVLGASAVSGFLQSFSESNRLREQRVMPYYQAGYYLVNADSDLRTLATMSYMSGLNEVACLLPDEHRYRVLVNTAWSIVSYIVASRSSIDHFDEQKRDEPSGLSARGAVEYIVSHPFRSLIRGFEQNIYFQLEPIIGAYGIDEEELLETSFRLWLARNHFLEQSRGSIPFERDEWGNLYEGEDYFKWAEQFYVPLEDKWADEYAASFTDDQLKHYRSVVRATVLATIGKEFTGDLPDYYRWNDLCIEDELERQKPIHYRLR